MKRLWALLMAIPMVLVILGGCSNVTTGVENLSESELAEQEEYREWIDKFFYFDFQGNELIDFQTFRTNDIYAAKILLPEKDVEAFIQPSIDLEPANIFEDYDMMRRNTLVREEALSDFVVVPQEQFDFSFVDFSTAVTPTENGDISTSRNHDVIVLKPKDGLATIYAIANFIHLDYEKP